MARRKRMSEMDASMAYLTKQATPCMWVHRPSAQNADGSAILEPVYARDAIASRPKLAWFTTKAATLSDYLDANDLTLDRPTDG